MAVQATLGHEILVGAHLDDALVLQHHDQVGVADGGEAVGDDDGGAALHQPFQRLLDQELGLGVHRRGGLVQHQDRRIFEDGAGDGQALLLPARELDAALADHGVIAFGQLQDELMGVGDLGGLDHLGLAGVGAAEQDVFADGAMEEEHVLQHDGHLGAQALGLQVAHVMAVDGDAALGDVIEARDQAGQGGFAHARGADQGHHRVGGDIQVDVL